MRVVELDGSAMALLRRGLDKELKYLERNTKEKSYRRTKEFLERARTLRGQLWGSEAVLVSNGRV